MTDTVKQSSMEEKKYPGPCFQVLLVIIIASVVPFQLLAFIADWKSLQSFYLNPSCVSPSLCFPYLGFSELELSCIASISSFLSVPLLLANGMILDRFGLPSAVLVMSLSCSTGAALHLFASYFTARRIFLLASITCGRTLLVFVNFMYYAIIQYIPLRFFRPERQSFIAGLLYVGFSLSFLIARWILPMTTLLPEPRQAFWVMMLASFGAFIFVALLAAVFRLSSDFVEPELKVKKEPRISFKNLVKTVKTSYSEYWFIAVILAINNFIQHVMFSSIPILGEQGLHFSWIQMTDDKTLCNILAPSLLLVLFGFLWTYAPFKCIFGLLACLLQSSCLFFSKLLVDKSNLLLILDNLSLPLISMLFILFLNGYVAMKSLGLGTTFISAVSVTIFGIWNFIKDQAVLNGD